MRNILLILIMAVVCLASCKRDQTPVPEDPEANQMLYKKWFYQSRTRTDFTAGQPPKINAPTTFNGIDYIYFSKHGYSGKYELTDANGNTVLRSLRYSYQPAVNEKGENTGSLLIHYANRPAYYHIKELKETSLIIVQKLYSSDHKTVIATIETVFSSE